MDLERFNRMLLESVGVGLAVVATDSHEILCANRRFVEWFPGESGIGRQLEEVFSDLDLSSLQERIDQGRSFVGEAQIKVKRRSVVMSLHLARAEQAGEDALILELQNISKVKELECMIGSYSKMVERQKRSLTREKERAEKLLLNLMPRSIYEELKTFGVTTPQKYDKASILMLDFVGFTDMAVADDPAGIVAELNDIFTAFDRISEQFGCERIKTMGDAYMAVSGIPEANPEHAENIATAALLMIRFLKRRNATHKQQWICRIGINSGPVIGSIVGVQKYVYDIFGPGVNLAARMEAFSEPMEITLCEDMARLIGNDFTLEERGAYEVKGFGPKRLYQLTGMQNDRASAPSLALSA